MSNIISKQDTNGTKTLLRKGEFGYDDYVAGGDSGRVYVGTGGENIPLAKKSDMELFSEDIIMNNGTINSPKLTFEAEGEDSYSINNTSGYFHISKSDGTTSLMFINGSWYKGNNKIWDDENTDVSTFNVLSSTKLATARTIGGVSFDGTANITLPGVNAPGTEDTTGTADWSLFTKSIDNHQWGSHAANGYIRLSTGIIIQWGEATATGSGGTTITLPISFPEGGLQITGSDIGSGCASIGLSYISKSQFTAYARQHDGTYPATGFRYIAIGY